MAHKVFSGPTIHEKRVKWEFVNCHPDVRRSVEMKMEVQRFNRNVIDARTKDVTNGVEGGQWDIHWSWNLTTGKFYMLTSTGPKARHVTENFLKSAWLAYIRSIPRNNPGVGRPPTLEKLDYESRGIKKPHIRPPHTKFKNGALGFYRGSLVNAIKMSSVQRRHSFLLLVLFNDVAKDMWDTDGNLDGFRDYKEACMHAWGL